MTVKQVADSFLSRIQCIPVFLMKRVIISRFTLFNLVGIRTIRTMKFSNFNISGCMAADPAGCVGLNNGLPWDYPDEFEHFKRTTAGHIMVMGRKTLEGTPVDHLKKCISIVFTHDKSRLQMKTVDYMCHFVTSLEDFDRVIKYDISEDDIEKRKIFVIGGVEITHLFFENNLINEFFLTKIHQEHNGDAYLNMNYFKCLSNEEVIKKTDDYTIYKLTK